MLTASGPKDLKASMNRVFFIGRDEIPSAVHLAEGESLNWTLVSLPGVSADVSLEMDIDGPSCEIDLAGLYLCPGDEKLRIAVTLRHNCGGSVSRQLFKGIAGGQSRVSFDGLIYVRKDALKTKAYQENHTILTGRGALVETRPQLEIYADDVECSHGATTGFLNESELFYMRSRGIPEDEARRLQMISFLSPVLNRLPEDVAGKIVAGL